uniref:Uncharacterized protein n=1 Tax=Lygus hesperus TaxID=30085 RepID=A0A146KRH7_LYGHE
MSRVGNTNVESTAVDENVNTAQIPSSTIKQKSLQSTGGGDRECISSADSVERRTDSVNGLAKQTNVQRIDFGGPVATSTQKHLLQLTRKHSGFIPFTLECMREMSSMHIHQPPNILASSILRKWELLPDTRKTFYDETAKA